MTESRRTARKIHEERAVWRSGETFLRESAPCCQIFSFFFPPFFFPSVAIEDFRAELSRGRHEGLRRHEGPRRHEGLRRHEGPRKPGAEKPTDEGVKNSDRSLISAAGTLTIIQKITGPLRWGWSQVLQGFR
ncbi:Hypothetical predicted protein [Xyrichtys novacula]|uniref:Uncharacterized protein n=1 Tax=Xyrichtys novacula TaxID=13765 RepID=A0AAV1G329_XYRNO|nr:Hypothetical predicted protein [Xyrichtys novacula]